MRKAMTKGRPGAWPCRVLLVGLLLLPSCAEYQVRVPDSDPIQLEGQEDEYVEKTIHAYFWGSVLDPQAVAAECQGEGINDIVIDRSYAHDLASALTLGIWMPMDVRFRCKAPGIDGGEFPSNPQ